MKFNQTTKFTAQFSRKMCDFLGVFCVVFLANLI